jgi:phosphoesterase RecJ-like protein
LATFDLSELSKYIANSKKVTITTHVSPDGDALGSSLAMQLFIKKIGIDSKVITPDHYPDFLHWLPEQDSVLNYEDDKIECEAWIKSSDLIICLDFNTADRMASLRQVIEESPFPKVLIDHHQNPVKWTEVMLSDSSASSTAELVYRIIEGLGHENLIDKEIGTCLYTGIVTDTGSFKFPQTSSDTMLIASKLMKLGVDTPKIQNLIYDNSSEHRLRLLGFSLTERLEIIQEYHTAIIGLDAGDLEKHFFQTGDTEGIVNYPLSISSVKMAVLITEKKGQVRMSFRSKGKVPVHDIAFKYFKGGGHVNAAGGISELSVKETIAYLKSILPEFREFLC